MGERKHIGLVFSYNENWIAGAYYILNIIHALNTLKDDRKPIITILSESKENFDIVKNETHYPHLNHLVYPFEKTNYSLIARGLNKMSLLVLKKKIFNKEKNIPKLDFIYPRTLYLLSNNLKKVNWVPDFQEDYLPHLFSEEEVLKRKTFQKNVIANGDIVVISSNDSRNDFVRLYPNAKALPYVLKFAVTHPDFSNEKIEDLKVKYKLNRDYFFAPNQFWAHKNHKVILEAVKHLKDKGVEVIVAMSGKENDYRNEDNFKELKDYIKNNHIEENIKFLGFLPRKEQLCLFSNAIAVIQPSLFEGWSTVVEDSKNLNKYLILSNLNVHKEQIKENVSFFNPKDPIELADHIETINSNKPNVKAIDYKENIINFGEDFMELVNLATTTMRRRK